MAATHLRHNNSDSLDVVKGSTACSGSVRTPRHPSKNDAYDVHRDQVPQHVKDVMLKVDAALELSKPKSVRRAGDTSGHLDKYAARASFSC